MRKMVIYVFILSMGLMLFAGCGLIEDIVNRHSPRNNVPTKPSEIQPPASPILPETGSANSKPPSDPSSLGSDTKSQTGLSNMGEQPDDEDSIEKQVKAMSLDEKIGQMVIVGLEGYTVDETAKKLIEGKHVGGFILYKTNVKDASQLLSLINSLKLANKVNKVPLFISVDEEGGRISRMPNNIKKLPTNKAIGEINDSSFSFEIGEVIAKELKAFGFNMDFAPVLDINSNHNNPVIGDRSFGSNAEIVTKLGIQTMKGIQAGGIVSVVKHFPGHGDTSVDSHIGLPVVNNSLGRLKSFELIPFASAIENKADAIMVAHILLPQIDRTYPASMSKIMITDILRNELKYDGVVVSDDLTMGAILKNYDIGEAAIKAIDAGIDILLVCHEYEKELAVINAVKEAVNDGTISEERIDASVYRILKLKQKYDISDQPIQSVSVKEVNDAISRVLER